MPMLIQSPPPPINCSASSALVQGAAGCRGASGPRRRSESDKAASHVRVCAKRLLHFVAHERQLGSFANWMSETLCECLCVIFQCAYGWCCFIYINMNQFVCSAGYELSALPTVFCPREPYFVFHDIKSGFNDSICFCVAVHGWCN